MPEQTVLEWTQLPWGQEVFAGVQTEVLKNRTGWESGTAGPVLLSVGGRI